VVPGKVVSIVVVAFGVFLEKQVKEFGIGGGSFDLHLKIQGGVQECSQISSRQYLTAAFAVI